jgi:hypothetical protein
LIPLPGFVTEEVDELQVTAFEIEDVYSEL